MAEGARGMFLFSVSGATSPLSTPKSVIITLYNRVMKLIRLLLLLCAFSLASYSMDSISGWCMNGGVKVSIGGNLSTTPFQASYPNCQVTVTSSYGALLTATYSTGGTIVGTAGQTCNASFTATGGGSGGVGTISLTSTNTIAASTPFVISFGGSYYKSSSQFGFTFTPGGTASCSGSGTITATFSSSPVSIFADPLGSIPLTNPFTAASSGQWLFYAPNGAYNVSLSGGGIPVPFTLYNLSVFDYNTYNPHIVEAYQLSGASGILESQSGDNTHVGGFKSASTMPNSILWTLPRVDAAGVWQSDGSDNLSIGPAPASGVDTDVQYNKAGVLGGDGNLTWNYTTPLLGINGLVSASVVRSQANIGNTAGGYFHLLPITYPNQTCKDIYGNVVNNPISISGDPITAMDALLWVSPSPLSGVGGCSTQLPTQQDVGINTNMYMLSLVGFASTNDRYNTFDAAPCGGATGCAIGGAHGGGMHALSFAANNYINVGQWAGIPPITPGDSFNPGAVYWDLTAHCLEVFNDGSPGNWSCVGSGGGGGGIPTGPVGALQFQSNPTGSFVGVAALLWNSTLNQLQVTTPTSATAGLAISNGYAQADSGFLGTTGVCTSYQCIQAPSGGVYSASLLALNYTQIGIHSGPPPITTGQMTFGAGALYWDTGALCVEAYNGTSFSCLGSGGGGGIPYTTTVSSVSSASISAATHGQGTLAIAECFSSASPRLAVACSYTRDSSGNLAFTFSPAFTGLIQVGSGGGSGGTGIPGGSTSNVQFNAGSGNFGGSGNFIWNGSLVAITAASSSAAGLSVGTGFIQSDAGLLVNKLYQYNDIQIIGDTAHTDPDGNLCSGSNPCGGMLARSVSNLRYTQLGSHSGVPSVTTGDTFNPGAIYYDTGAHCFNGRFDTGGGIWACLGSSTGTPPGGSNTNIQFNNSGVFGGSGNLSWITTGGLQQLKIISLSSTAGLYVSVGNIQSDAGFASLTCTRYNCFQPINGGGSLAGGMAALSFTAVNYVNIGNANVGSATVGPPITSGDTPNPGAAFFDTGSTNGAPCFRVYTGTTWPCLVTSVSSGVVSLNSLTGTLNLAGTTNEVIVSPSGTTITLSTPQGIGTTSTPTFNGVIVSGSTPAFNSTASGSTVAFQTSNTNFEVDGAGDLSMVGQLNLNSGAILKVGGTTTIDSSRNIYGATFTSAAQFSSTATGASITFENNSGSFYVTGAGNILGQNFDSNVTGTSIAFENNNGTFSVLGNGTLEVNGSLAGLNVQTSTAYNSIQSNAGFNSTGNSSSGYVFTVAGSGVITNSGQLQGTGAIGTGVGAFNVSGGYIGQSWTITFTGGISGIGGCSSGLVFRGGILVSCF